MQPLSQTLPSTVIDNIMYITNKRKKCYLIIHVRLGLKHGLSNWFCNYICIEIMKRSGLFRSSSCNVWEICKPILHFTDILSHSYTKSRQLRRCELKFDSELGAYMARPYHFPTNVMILWPYTYTYNQSFESKHEITKFLEYRPPLTFKCN